MKKKMDKNQIKKIMIKKWISYYLIFWKEFINWIHKIRLKI